MIRSFRRTHRYYEGDRVPRKLTRPANARGKRLLRAIEKAGDCPTAAARLCGLAFNTLFLLLHVSSYRAGPDVVAKLEARYTLPAGLAKELQTEPAA